MMQDAAAAPAECIKNAMADDIRGKLEQLRHSTSVLEGQRAALGDAVVEPALAALR